MIVLFPSLAKAWLRAHPAILAEFEFLPKEDVRVSFYNPDHTIEFGQFTLSLADQRRVLQSFVGAVSNLGAGGGSNPSGGGTGWVP